MKLKMRTTMRRSQEDIESSFNPINLDHIFQEDYLAPWIEEREGPLLEGAENAGWLPVDSDDEFEEPAGGDASNSGQVPSEGGDGGLSTPSEGNSGSSGGNGGVGNLDQSYGVGEGPFFSYNEEPSVRRDENLLPPRMEGDSHENMTAGRSRGQAKRGKGRRHEATPMDYSSSSSVSQSFGNFGLAAQSDDSQGNYPSYYQPPSYMPHGYYPYMPNPNLPQYQPPMNYNDSSATSSYGYQQIEPPRSSGLFDYVFGGSGYNNDEGDSGSYDPARHSTMW